MVSVALKYSANEALATFILASDIESNGSSLETSNRYDPEVQPWFRGTEFDEIQENYSSIVDQGIFCDIENYDSCYKVSLKYRNLLPTFSFLFHMVFSYL